MLAPSRTSAQPLGTGSVGVGSIGVGSVDGAESVALALGSTLGVGSGDRDGSSLGVTAADGVGVAGGVASTEADGLGVVDGMTELVAVSLGVAAAGGDSALLSVTAESVCVVVIDRSPVPSSTNSQST